MRQINDLDIIQKTRKRRKRLIRNQSWIKDEVKNKKYA
jgi:hypothetical protein